MTKCSYCGRENDEAAKVCSECGTELTKASVKPDQEGVTDEISAPLAIAFVFTCGILFLTGFLSMVFKFPFGWIVVPGVAIWAACDSAQWRKRARACLEPDEMLPDLATSNATKPFVAFAYSLFFCYGFPCYLIARYKVKKWVEFRERKLKQADSIGGN